MSVLIPELLHTFVSKIIVYEKEVKYSKNAPQKVKIIFRDFQLSEGADESDEMPSPQEKADKDEALSA